METKAKKKLTCPECGEVLKEVYAEANYGRVLLLDQCQGCGGVWFDRWELYFVKGSSLMSLEAVDIKTLLSQTPHGKGKNSCPRCEKELIKFKDPGLPKDALIERCGGCGGLWLNRGELSKYARHKESITGMPLDGKEQEINVLKNLQKELDAKTIAPTATLTELELANGADSGPIDTKEMAKDIGFLALQSLVRLVFKI